MRRATGTRLKPSFAPLPQTPRSDGGAHGLSSAEGAERLRVHGRNVLRERDELSAASVLAAQLLRLAAINAALETGLENPLDDAILAAHKPDLTNIEKLDEVPFDFARSA